MKLVLLSSTSTIEDKLTNILPFLKKNYDVFLCCLEQKNPDSFSDIQIEQINSFIQSKGECVVYGYGIAGALLFKVAMNSLIQGIITHDAPLQQVLSNHFRLFRQNLENLNIPIRVTYSGAFSNKEKRYGKELADILLQKGYYFEIPNLSPNFNEIPEKHLARHIHTQINSMNYQWVKTKYGAMTYQVIDGIKEKKEQPLLLFLHESLGSIVQWKMFPKRLCKQLNLPGLVIEMPGYGFSSPESKDRGYYYLHEFAQDYLPSFLEALQIESPLILVGHSDGGTNALLYSAKYPTKVKAMVTLAAHYLNEEITREGILKAVEAKKKGKFLGLELFHGTKTKRLFKEWSATWLSKEFLKWNIYNDIQNNKTPALVIQGDKDQYGTPAQVEGIIEAVEQATPCFIKNCGHQPHLQQEEQVIQTIERWMNNLK